MNRFSKNFIILKTVILLALFFFCTSARSQAAGELNYRLKWLYNSSVVGDIYAMDHGFFAKEGLTVQVKEGGPERDAIRELELGHAQFGAASADQVIRAIEKKSPVVVVAQLFQVNPLQWIYRSRNLQIKSLQDLRGKIIGITFGGNDDNIMSTLLAQAGISEGDYTPYSVRYDLTPFYQKKTDLWPCYLNSQGVIFKQKLEREGENVAFLNPADYGVQFVANSVVTSRQMIKERPEVVRKFVTALMAAWDASLDPVNQEKTMATLLKFDKNTAPDIQLLQLEATRPLIKPSPKIRMGAVDTDAWKQTEAIMLKQKQIRRPVNIEAAFHPFF